MKYSCYIYFLCCFFACLFCSVIPLLAQDTDGDGIINTMDVDDDNNGLIEIRNLNMLDSVRYDLSGRSYAGDSTGCPTGGCKGYELTQNLDFSTASSYANNTIDTAWRPNHSNPDSATNTGWTPIGPTSGGTSGFTGNFDGNGYHIAGLYVRNNNGNIGLFALINSRGVVRNLGVTNAHIYGGTGANIIGGLVGSNIGSITTCHTTGNTYGGGEEDYVGGLVGNNINNGSITACYTMGNTDGGDGNIDYVGGLVGNNNGIITACYTTGNTDGGNGSYDFVGGLIGNNNGIITACYTTGNTDGGNGNNDNIGVLMGSNTNTITASYGFGSATNGTSNSVGAPPNGISHPGWLTLSNTDSTWNLASSNTLNAWDFGDSTQNPVLRYADYDGASNTYDCGLFPTSYPDGSAIICGASLLPGQGRKNVQSLSFSLGSDSIKTFGDTSFTLSASSTSGLTDFIYTSSDTNVATILGNTVTITGVGTSTITLKQAGNTYYNADSITATLTVNKGNQNLSFSLGSDSIKTFGDTSFILSASSTSGLTNFIYTSSDTNVATISGNTLTITGVGTSTITLKQAGNTYYNADSITATLTVNKGNQSLSFSLGSDSVKTIGDTSFTLSASSTSGLTNFIYTSSDTNVAAISGNTVTILRDGLSTITVSQAGNDNWNVASASAVLIVNDTSKMEQTLMFSLGNDSVKTFGDAPFTLSASSTSGLTDFIYTSSDTSVATISGNTVSLVGAGTSTITITQAGNNTYNVATATALLTVNDAPNSIIEVEAVSIYPSGDNGFTIDGLENIKEVVLLNFHGKIVKYYHLPEYLSFSLQNLPSGIYIVKITTQYGNIYMKKLLNR